MARGAEPPERPIERGLAGPGLLAITIVHRWQDHLPLYRLESIYARDGLDLARSTICGWHEQLADLAEPLVEAMLRDAFTQPYLCTDATGVLVQAAEQCQRAHFWVLVAPERHVLYRFSHKADNAAVDRLLAGYKGYLVADAASVFDHLYTPGDIVEVACWCHLRRYFCKALGSDPERAQHALSLTRAMYKVERTIKDEAVRVLRRRRGTLAGAVRAWGDGPRGGRPRERGPRAHVERCRGAGDMRHQHVSAAAGDCRPRKKREQVRHDKSTPIVASVDNRRFAQR